MAAPARSSRIDVVGLRDLQRELRALDKTMPRELRKANIEAAEVVAQATRQSFSSRPGVAPKVAASVKALGQQRNASVRIGGPKYPYAMGSNFGSIRFKQFPAVKHPDYSLYTSIRSERKEVLDTYDEALKRLTKKAFPN
jgi:hypothetical protein